jgi:hypothetical protein
MRKTALILLSAANIAFAASWGYVCDGVHDNLSIMVGVTYKYSMDFTTLEDVFDWTMHKTLTLSLAQYQEGVRNFDEGHIYNTTSIGGTTFYNPVFHSSIDNPGVRNYIGHAHYMNTALNQLYQDRWCYITTDGDTLPKSASLPAARRVLYTEITAVTPPNQDNRFYPSDPYVTNNVQTQAAPANWGANVNEAVPFNSNPANLWKCPDTLYYASLFHNCALVNKQQILSDALWRKMSNTLGCNDKSEFHGGTLYDVYDLSGNWDPSLNCGQGGYTLIRTPNDQNKKIIMDRTLIYDTDGKCLNCGGIGFSVYKCRSNWRFKETPGCQIARVGSDLTGAIGVGLTALSYVSPNMLITNAVTTVGSPVLSALSTGGGAALTYYGSLKLSYEVGCIEFGYDEGEYACDGIAYIGLKALTSLISSDPWYIKDTIAQGTDVAGNNPPYTRTSHPEMWNTDRRQRFHDKRDSISLPENDNLDTLANDPAMQAFFREYPGREQRFRDIMKKNTTATGSLNMERFKTKGVDSSLTPEQTYTEDDINKDIGRADLEPYFNPPAGISGHVTTYKELEERKRKAIEKFNSTNNGTP